MLADIGVFAHDTRVSYRLLAIDLDGTLYTQDGRIATHDRDAIARVSAAGVHITIVTGRLYSGSRDAVQALGVRGPIACINGSQMVDTRDHRDLVHHRIDGALATQLRDITDRSPTVGYGLFDDRIVYDARGDTYLAYLNTWSHQVERVSNLSRHAMWEHEHGLSAFVGVGASAAIEDTVAAIEKEVPDAHVVSFKIARYADTDGLVVRRKGSDKGVALRWLAQHHGCSIDEVVAVGDWLNDRPMLACAGRSFAMSHAPDEIKAVATDVLSQNTADGGGVAEAIKRAFG